MRPLFRQTLSYCLIALLCGLNLLLPLTAQAQLSVSLKLPSGTTLPIAGRNIPRADDSIVIYSDEYGESTHTNAFGVEVLVKPVSEGGTQYKVDKIQSIFECQSKNDMNACGNMKIGPHDVVISASGNKRQPLLDALQVGTTVALEEDWFEHSQFKITAINPNMSNNPNACGFPGCRGGQQLVVYNQNYDKPTTTTNEYGFEVTVVNGIVVEHEGSDSLIPREGAPEQSFVLSGHGSARNWLIKNAPIGAKMTLTPDGVLVSSLIDFETYKFQVNQRLAKSKCPVCSPREVAALEKYKQGVRENMAAAEQAYHQGQASVAVHNLMDTLDDLNKRLWTEYPAYPNSAVKAIWHRPTEKSVTAISETLDKFKTAGLNTVFLETVFHGYTIFPSQTMSAYGLPTQNPAFSNFDYLAVWLAEAHKRDMKITPWIHTFYVGNKALSAPGPVLSKYPDWANVQYSALIVKTPPKPPQVTKKRTPVKKITHKAPAKKSVAKIAVKPLLKKPVNTALSVAKPQAKVVSTVAMDPGAPVPSLGPEALPDTPPQAQFAAPTPQTDVAPNLNPPPFTPLPRQNPQNPAMVPSKPAIPAVIRETPKTPQPSTLEIGSYFMDPANPAVQDFVVLLVREIATRYPVDGIQLDYIRYPSSFPKDRYSFQKTTWGYSNYSRNKFKGYYGADPADLSWKTDSALWEKWEQYKSDAVSNVVMRVHDQLAQDKPNLPLTTVVFPNLPTALEQKHQDWARWSKSHWVNYLSSITLTSSVKVVGSDTSRVLRSINQSVPVVIGVFGPFNGNSAEHLLEQIEVARNQGAAGFGIFDSAHLTPRMVQALNASQGQKQLVPVVTTPAPVNKKRAR